MTGRRVLKQIFLRHKNQLLLADVLFGLEMLGLLLRPLLPRRGRKRADPAQLPRTALAGWCAAALAQRGHRPAYVRHAHLFGHVHVVTGMLRRVREAAVSRMSAHSSLAREFVDFLEYDINYVIEALYNLLGSLILLCFYEKKVVLLCGVMLIPVLVLSDVYGPRMKWLNKLKNNELERQVDVIGTRDRESIRTHYERLRSWQVRISDQEAWNFGAMELLVLVVITASLLITERDGRPAISSACTITSSISCRARHHSLHGPAHGRAARHHAAGGVGGRGAGSQSDDAAIHFRTLGRYRTPTRHHVLTRRKTSHVS